MLYLNYGVTGSGSTLLYNISRFACKSLGFSQELSKVATQNNRIRNYSEDLSEQQLRLFDNKKKGLLVVKTHSPPSDFVKRMLTDNQMLANVAIRDPRDIVLSVLDKAKIKLENNILPNHFESFSNFEIAFEAIVVQMDAALSWADLPNVRVFSYTKFSSNPYYAFFKIFNQIKSNRKLEVSHIGWEHLQQKLNKVDTNLHIGKIGRYKQHFTSEQISRFDSINSDFHKLLNKE